MPGVVLGDAIGVFLDRQNVILLAGRSYVIVNRETVVLGVVRVK